MLLNLLRAPLTPDVLLSALIAAGIILLVCIPVHEWAHCFTAYKMGDLTPKSQGRLTLNPLAHLDLMGTVFMLLCGFGWGKAAVINPRNFKNPKAGMAISAAAGPLSNILMAYIGMIAWKLIVYTATNPFTASDGIPATIIITFIHINLILAVFNLIPVPPLDGSRILALFLPKRAYFGLMKYERYSFIIIAVLVMLGITQGIISTGVNALTDALDFLTGYIDAILL